MTDFLPDGAAATQRPDFTRDTAVTSLGDGAYAAICSTRWAAPMGPNGGYLAAIVLRAMLAEVDDAARVPRALTLHYLRPPADGEVGVTVAVERSGRSLSTVTARLEQGGRLCIIAVGAFGTTFPTAADYATPPPVVAPWASIELMPKHEGMPPVSHRLHLRLAIGAEPFSGADEAVSGGWVSLRDPAPVDAVLLALLVDAWLPSVFPILTTPVGAPTIDLTIHFRNPDAAAAHPPDEPLLAVFRSTTSQDGYFEEDGEIWTPAGVLLAQSRQLALLRPMRGTPPATA
ncbi:MAG: thioesterase family protein [Solirubrobacterales bacterium]|nr:thioesterase family protein [Solirubrobacterales bacterium]